MGRCGHQPPTFYFLYNSYYKYKIKKNFDSKQSAEIDYVINFVRESHNHEGADKIYIHNLSSDGLPINFSYFIL